eukprot:5580766-Pyramimonas_sp.AAC.1
MSLVMLTRVVVDDAGAEDGGAYATADAYDGDGHDCHGDNDDGDANGKVDEYADDGDIDVDGD